MTEPRDRLNMVAGELYHASAGSGGARSVVSAGSVVLHAVPADCVVAGSPARVVRTSASTVQTTT